MKFEAYAPNTETTDTLNVNAAAENPQTLRDSVEIAMRNYFSHLDGQEITNVHQMVLNEVEAPMLEAVMRYCRDNQTKASKVLGLNRGTLRKKLKQYGLL
ncbi:DNA-binding transcriptional regulator Fis [Reinekea thalattae]|uniref:Putative Fis-like DNA-binding protein n=1 Tax=Reinekea thalattae TaxID=2593301 RepID=A0A5C8Z4Z0_9GAMM|nr:DNA-binding transcriptional regulator Fis [Reinekea thalattae]TXR51976.1 DNA-binding transcriptional regulator Fis [Reinekea thalattae]